MPGMCAKRDKGVPLLRKGVASGKLLFQRRSGAKANHSSLAICKAPEVLLSRSTATTTTAMSTTRATIQFAGNLQGGERRESAQEDEELRSALPAPSSCRTSTSMYLLLTAFRIA